jgi:hypothetical protein
MQSFYCGSDTATYQHELIPADRILVVPYQADSLDLANVFATINGKHVVAST